MKPLSFHYFGDLWWKFLTAKEKDLDLSNVLDVAIVVLTNTCTQLS